MSRPSAAPRGGGRGGRPSLGEDKPILIKLGPLRSSVDAYADAAGLNRSAAIRHLIAAGLTQPVPKPARRTAPRAATTRAPQAATPEQDNPAPRKATKPGRPKLQRHTDPRTAATLYDWEHPAGVRLEARRRRFPDGKERWELHHLEGSAIPAAAEHADPVGDAWVKLGDLRHDLDRLAQALDIV